MSDTDDSPFSYENRYLPAFRSLVWSKPGLKGTTESLAPEQNSANQIGQQSDFQFIWDRNELHEDCKRTHEATNWDALLDIVKDLTGEDTSFYDGVVHAGVHHIVRRIKLPCRGETWVARVPVWLGSDMVKWWTNAEQFEMESEIAAMKFMSQSTDIPVPEPLAYNTGIVDNRVQLPYLLSTCLYGNTLWDLVGYKPDILDTLTDEQMSTLSKSVARMHCKLSQVTVDKLGCLMLQPDGEVDIGPLPGYDFNHEGPYTFIEDFVAAWADSARAHRFRSMDQILDKPDWLKIVEEFPRRLLSLAASFEATQSPGKFPILHPDLGPHNLLLNDQFEVAGVLDWEWAHAVPFEVYAARMMEHMVDYDWDHLHLKVDKPREKQYMEHLRQAEEDLGLSPKLSEAPGSLLYDLGKCMWLYALGKGVQYLKLLDRAEKAE